MCISEKFSLGAFIVCFSACFYLFKRNNKNDRWIAVLFLYLGSMQFLEFLMWRDQKCEGLNQKATNLGFWHNILQPIVSLIIAYYFTGGNIPKWIYIIFIIYMLTSFPKILKSKIPNQCSKPCSNTNIGLEWKYTKTENMGYVWLIFCLALLAPLLAMEGGKIYGLLILITYIIAHFISVSRCPNSIVPSNGSWWCLMAAFIPLIAIKLNKI